MTEAGPARHLAAAPDPVVAPRVHADRATYQEWVEQHCTSYASRWDRMKNYDRFVEQSWKHWCMPSEMTVSLTPKSEYGALENFLDAQRIGLIRKVEGVSDELARQAPTASSLSLLGLIKHTATWEQRWFQVIMAGRQSPDRWPGVMPEPHDAELIIRDSDTVMHWIAVYREHIETSNAIAAAMDLDAPCARTDLIECNMRYVLFHMIEETARHAGHADIIRETLDGSRGI